MRIKKVFAGIAALATLLGGLAVGASAAQAAPTNIGNTAVKGTPGTITVVNAQEGHTYSAYKIASFSNVKVLKGQLVSLDIQTESSQWVSWLNSAFSAAGFQDDPNYADNPAARLATLTADDASKVVNNINSTSVAEGNVKPNATKSNDGTEPKDLQLTDLPDGWYVVSDYKGNQKGRVALVATTITVDNTPYTKFMLNEAQDQSSVNDALGVFYAKEENTPSAPSKTVNKDGYAWEKKSVSIGDQLDYNVQSAISPSAANYQSYPYKIMDRASRGLTVNVDSIQIKVSDDRAGKKNPVTLQKGKGKDYTVDYRISDGTDGDSKGTTTTTITFANTVAPQYAGKYVTVTYTATVNADAVSAGQYSQIDKATGLPVSPVDNIAAGTVTNRAYVQHNNGDWTDPGERTVYTGAFEFQKYGAADTDKDGLNGVEFEVYAGKTVSEDKLLKFTKNDDGSYTYNPNGQRTVTTVTSATIGNKKGVVSLKGLQGANGTGVYTIKETKTVDSYTQQILATFSVELRVNTQGVSTVSLLQAANNGLGLASESNGAIRVKNVQNVTQLPLTGAAGITLFAVIAVLFAAVAAVLIVKFRSARRELEA